MTSYTIEEMMQFDPCYSREQVADLWAGRERLSLLEILDLPIPAKDRIWATTWSGDHLPRFAGLVADRAVRNHCLNCGIPDVEDWAAKWLSGADRTQAAAWAAAKAADASAWASARAAAAWKAADAAKFAAAAWKAADASAWAAAKASARAAAAEFAAAAAEEEASSWEAAERELQILDMRTAIGQATN